MAGDTLHSIAGYERANIYIFEKKKLVTRMNYKGKFELRCTTPAVVLPDLRYSPAPPILNEAISPQVGCVLSLPALRSVLDCSPYHLRPPFVWASACEPGGLSL